MLEDFRVAPSDAPRYDGFVARTSTRARAALVVSQPSFDSSDDADIVQSNVSFVRLLLEEGVAPGKIHPIARAGYYVTFYNAQVRNGGFAQLVRNTKWQRKWITAIEDGLADLGPTLAPHAEVFGELQKYMAKVPAKDLRSFLAANTVEYGKNLVVRTLKWSGLGDRFYALPDPTALVAACLRNHAELQVHPIEGMFEIAERIVGRAVAR